MKQAHRKYRKAARRAYRILIVLCCLALIAAVLVWYARQGAS
ncbi:MAG TPA: hypothetical protein VLL47_10260 [Robiginitalea sp.]|nr:hypothetical protein [Robiginitalea sp.]